MKKESNWILEDSCIDLRCNNRNGEDMEQKDRLPKKVEEARNALCEFIMKSRQMVNGKIFALLISEEGLGEKGLVRVLTESDRTIIPLPGEALKNHDVGALKGAIWQRLNSIDQTEDKFVLRGDAGLWEVLFDAKRFLKGLRPILFLNLTQTPLNQWSLWRTGVEEDNCSICIICRQSQWELAKKEIPEITGCVIDQFSLTSFLDRNDLNNLPEIIGSYCNELPTPEQIEIIRSKIDDKIGEIKEPQLENIIWNALTEGC